MHVPYEMPNRFELDLLPDGFYRIFDKDTQTQGFYDQGGIYRSGKLKLPQEYVADTIIGKHKSKSQQVGDFGNNDAGTLGVLGGERATESILHQLIREELKRRRTMRYITNIKTIIEDMNLYEIKSWFYNNTPEEWKELEETYIVDWGKVPAFEIEKLLSKLLAPVKPLHSNIIKRLLGVGSYKSAFLLDNDHVLAIGQNMEDDFPGREVSPSIYGDIMQQQFDPEGGASASDVPIYDHGEFANTMLYVEMGRVETFKDRIERTKKFSASYADANKAWDKSKDTEFRTPAQKAELVRQSRYHDPRAWRTELVWIQSTVTKLLIDMATKATGADPFKPRTKLTSQQVDAYLSAISEAQLWNKIMGNTWITKQLDREIKTITREEALAYIKSIVRIAKQRGISQAQDAHYSNVGFLPHSPSKMAVFDLA